MPIYFSSIKYTKQVKGLGVMIYYSIIVRDKTKDDKLLYSTKDDSLLKLLVEKFGH